jgi:prophage antirepressor-like protein
MMLKTVTSTEGVTLTPIHYQGRPAVIARELGDALGYAKRGKRFVDSIMGSWSSEFEEGVHYVKLHGAELKVLQAAIASRGTDSVPLGQGSLIVLFESGANLALTLTKKPAGRSLRRWLSAEVLPQVARSGAFDPTKKVDEAGRIVERPPAEVKSWQKVREERLAGEALRDELEVAQNVLRRAGYRDHQLLPLVSERVKALGGPSLSGLRPTPPRGFRKASAIASALNARYRLDGKARVTRNAVGLATNALCLKVEGSHACNIPSKASHGKTVHDNWYYDSWAMEQVEKHLLALGKLPAQVAA